MSQKLVEVICRKFLKSESGATAIEYALIAAGISIVIIGSIAILSSSMVGLFETIAGSF